MRRYLGGPIEEEKRQTLNALAERYNNESGLNIQIVYDEPQAFSNFLAHYGSFENVNNYIALVGKKGSEEACGYYGEKLVLKAQQLGLNTCWVALTYSKGKAKVVKNKGEKIICVIALGYGKTQGAQHRSKSVDEILTVKGEKPTWLDRGVEAAMLAPTATNQQKFSIVCEEGKAVVAKSGFGFYNDVDIGIVKCHFDLATGKTDL